MASNHRRLHKRMGYLMLRMLTATVDAMARVLPLSWLRGVATIIAHLICLLIPSRQRMAAENIGKAFGNRFTAAERRRVARQATVNICWTMVELLKMQYMGPEEIKELVSLEGLEHLHAAQHRGKGIIILSAHFGGWEPGGARITSEGFPMVVIARDANEKRSASLINRARRRHNMTAIDRDDLRAMLRVLRSNQALGILPDQHAANGGIIMDFLGRPASTAPGPAVLALRTGCAIVPFFTYRQPDGSLHTRVLPALEVTRTGNRDQDVRRLTERINQIIADQITERPEQWLWLHNRWKADRETAGS